MGLDLEAALRCLLSYPLDLVRLGARWTDMEPSFGAFDPTELDRHLELVERSGKGVILSLGAVKNFGYPEFFVPAHRLPRPLPEGSLVGPQSHPELLAAAVEFVSRVVARYHRHPGVLAWQVEHEAVDPLGLEHSWRLTPEFVEREVQAVRAADPTRPVLISGFLAASLPVRLHQRWRTRGQGDSLALAERVADIIGVDYYPRHALAGAGGLGVYLDGARPSLPRTWRSDDRFGPARRVMITEGQAEPWEMVTSPPSPAGRVMYSCPPERVIANYNLCLSAAREAGIALDAYLFWGAEYWLRRAREGDRSYLEAFETVVGSPRSDPT